MNKPIEPKTAEPGQEWARSARVHLCVDLTQTQRARLKIYAIREKKTMQALIAEYIDRLPAE